MRNRFTLMLLTVAIFSIGCGNQTNNPVKESISLDKDLENAILQSQIPTTFSTNFKSYIGLSYAIHYKGKDYYYNYGETKVGNKTKPTEESLYEIGSITKTFTSLLLAKAVIDGKVNLSNKITKYLPDSLKQNTSLDSITLQSLSNHSSGLPRQPDNLKSSITDRSQPYDNYNERHLFSFLKHYNAINKPGERFEYSNLAYSLLGVILERVYRKPYETLLAQSVTEPLKLSHTIITIREKDKALLVQGHYENDKEAPVWQQHLKGAGSILSSASDLLIYGKAQLPNATTGLTKSIVLTQKKTFTEDNNSIGLGWHLLPNSQDKVIMHTGRTGGQSSFIAIDLTKSIVIVMLSNKSTRQQEVGLKLLSLISRE